MSQSENMTQENNTKKNIVKANVTMRNMDMKLWKKARVHVINEGMTLTQYIINLIEKDLSNKG